MSFKNELCVLGFLALLLLGAASLIIKDSQASEKKDVEFEVIALGDQSGYDEESYLVVRTEVEWAKVWEKHTALYMPATPYPEIAFSENMVICAFMGKRPTTGYSISVERMWTEERRMCVEITKSSPQKNVIVGEVLTYPYVFASLERTDLEVVFNVIEENGMISEYTVPEFPMMAFTLTAFMVLSVAMVALTCKARRNHHSARICRAI